MEDLYIHLPKNKQTWKIKNSNAHQPSTEDILNSLQSFRALLESLNDSRLTHPAKCIPEVHNCLTIGSVMEDQLYVEREIVLWLFPWKLPCRHLGMQSDGDSFCKLQPLIYVRGFTEPNASAETRRCCLEFRGIQMWPYPEPTAPAVLRSFPPDHRQ